MSRGKERSADAKRILSGQITDTELALMLGMRVAVVRAKLIAVRPVNEGGQDPVYRAKDAFPYLVRLPHNVFEQVLRTNHKDIPPEMRKEYWQAQQAMLKVKEIEGQLFSAATVVAYVGELIKTFRMALLLVPDQLERTDTIPPELRDTIRALIDGALEACLVEANQRFGQLETDPNGNPGGPLAYSDGPGFGESGSVFDRYPSDWTPDEVAEAEGL